ncbi:MAG: hypothetical protein ACYCQI_10395 [Gammaproteobacteria bacterium]
MAETRADYHLLDDPDVQAQAQANSEARANAAAGIIDMPLPKELVDYFSSDDYSNLYGSFLNAADVPFTWIPRYSIILEGLYNPGSMGPLIEATSQSLPLALLVYALIGAGSAYNFYVQYKNKKDAHQDKCDSYSKIRQQLKLEAAADEKDELILRMYNDEIKAQFNRDEIDAFNKKVKKAIDEMNDALNAIVNENPAIKRRYEGIQILAPKIIPGKKLELSDIKIRHHFKMNSTPTSEADDAVKKPGYLGKFANKVLKPLKDSLGNASYMYWILFMVAVISVGEFAAAGIAGVPHVVSFGLPLLAALPLPALKIRNWFRNKGFAISDEYARLKKIAEGDTPCLLAEAAKRVEFSHELTRLQKENEAFFAAKQKLCLASPAMVASDTFSLINLINVTRESNHTPTPAQLPANTAFGARPSVQAAATLYTATIGEYGMLQYNAWILSDFFKVGPSIACCIPFFGPIAGGVLIAVGLGLGIYEAHKKYKAIKRDQADADHEKPTKSLVEIFVERQSQLQALTEKRTDLLAKLDHSCASKGEKPYVLSKVLNKPIPQLPGDLNPVRKPFSLKSLWNSGRKLFSCFDWAATGIFFARLMFLPGTAVFLPFAAAALSNPVTIGILVASGLLFVGVKLYQAHQKQKEMETRELMAGIKQMDEQIQVAEMTEKNLVLKQETLDLMKAPAPRAEVAPEAEVEPTRAPTNTVECPAPSAARQIPVLFGKGGRSVERSSDLTSTSVNSVPFRIGSMSVTAGSPP